jgi:hypothetical protein
MQCDKCKWYRGDTDHTGPAYQGKCHRYPPVFTSRDYPITSVCIEDFGESQLWNHPQVDRDNWCGEFTPKGGI